MVLGILRLRLTSPQYDILTRNSKLACGISYVCLAYNIHQNCQVKEVFHQEETDLGARGLVLTAMFFPGGFSGILHQELIKCTIGVLSVLSRGIAGN